ncbi:hypothetical protein SYNPS1DRAFT_27458 [Syncephalis pseudoplumigaleata]|uniref:Sister chromatid cohesion protein Dcc1 n=1 Tax=Syncephalis pseudoplumigaleata TaxID=1712513 RepID=A0A4P9Z385_9FUNG|nr:hypothetical protein SYNPS1DRAFT_27458 [Syncephalis pseudoplumigaleata]|eukprot:RKP26865.1 hypothetical protein SYNPS1DRAFT_27458 [Syncephalis pseudoplumigaleata]
MPYDLATGASTRPLRLAYAADYEERGPAGGGVVATEDLENHGYALLELDEALEQALLDQSTDQPSSSSSPSTTLVIRGQPRDEAVLCTSSSTFALRRVEWSNALLVVDAGSAADAAEDEVQPGTSATIQATLAHLLEARPIKANTTRLPELMAQAKAVWDGVSPLTKVSACTLDELRAQVQASDYELVEGLVHYDIVQLEDGGYRQITSEHLCHVLASIFTACAAEDIRLDDRAPVTLRQCFAFMGLAPSTRQGGSCSSDDADLLSPMVVRHCFRKFATTCDADGASGDAAMHVDEAAYEDRPHVFVESSVCRYIGQEVLRQHKSIHYEQHAFMEAWSASVPEGYTVSLDMLEGICIPNETDDAAGSGAAPKTLLYLPIDELPRDPAARMRMLFDMRAKWSAEELRVYLADIAITPAQIDMWLMKYARRVTATGAMARHGKRKAHGQPSTEQVWYCARIIGAT